MRSCPRSRSRQVRRAVLGDRRSQSGRSRAVPAASRRSTPRSSSSSRPATGGRNRSARSPERLRIEDAADTRGGACQQAARWPMRTGSVATPTPDDAAAYRRVARCAAIRLPWRPPIRLLAASDEPDPALDHRINREQLGHIDAIIGCGDLERLPRFPRRCVPCSRSPTFAATTTGGAGRGFVRDRRRPLDQRSPRGRRWHHRRPVRVAGPASRSGAARRGSSVARRRPGGGRAAAPGAGHADVADPGREPRAAAGSATPPPIRTTSNTPPTAGCSSGAPPLWLHGHTIPQASRTGVMASDRRSWRT